MAIQNGYALVYSASGEEIISWVWDQYGILPEIPNVMQLPNGDRVHCPSLDVDYGGCRLTRKYTNDEPPDPGLASPSMIAAAFNVVIANGDIQSIGGAFNLVGALYLGTGQYMLLFLKPETNTDYVAQVIDGGMNIRVSEKGEDYMIIESRNADGDLSDAAQFGLQVYRF